MLISSYHRSKVIRDPIHGLIELDEDKDVILALINSAEFQRLRRIKQLGISSLTYPGAEHTRFAHSLGVFNTAQKILQKLEYRYRKHHRIPKIINGEAGTHVRIAALLHDIGHGPFSHASERAFDVGKQHEERSKSLIRDKGSEIHEILKKYISDSGIQAVWMLLDSHQYPFLHDIISSQLDADRMDYLLRDSHSVGVQYGHFDMDWLFNGFCLGQNPNPEEEISLENCRLCLDSKRGAHAAAQLIIARMHMSLQVYFHKATRGWEAHLLCLFDEATRLAAQGKLPSSTMPVVRSFLEKKGNVEHSEFRQLDDACMYAHFQCWAELSDPEFLELSAWSKAIVRRKKRMCLFDLSRKEIHSEAVAQIKEKLVQEFGSEKQKWILDSTDFKAYRAPKDSLQQGEPDSYWAEISKTAILLSDGNCESRSQPIHNDSELLRGISSGSIPIRFLYVEDSLKQKTETLLKPFLP